jgi:hypothetical protein
MQSLDLHFTIEINGESADAGADAGAGAVSVFATSAEMCMPTGTVDKGSLKTKFRVGPPLQPRQMTTFNNNGDIVSCK